MSNQCYYNFKLNLTVMSKYKITMSAAATTNDFTRPISILGDSYTTVPSGSTSAPMCDEPDPLKFHRNNGTCVNGTV